MQLFKSQWLQETRRPLVPPARGYGARYGMRRRPLLPEPAPDREAGTDSLPAVAFDWPGEHYDRAA